MDSSKILCTIEIKNTATFRNEDHRREVGDSIRLLLNLINPYRKEIVSLIGVLNTIWVNFRIIAACLNLQNWKKFMGHGEWTEKDVKKILEGNEVLTKSA